MGWQIVMIGIGLVGCSLIVTIDSWLDLASNPGFCTTLALAQTGPGNNTSVPQIYNLTTVIQFDRNIFGSIVAFGFINQNMLGIQARVHRGFKLPLASNTFEQKKTFRDRDSPSLCRARGQILARGQGNTRPEADL